MHGLQKNSRKMQAGDGAAGPSGSRNAPQQTKKSSAKAFHRCPQRSPRSGAKRKQVAARKDSEATLTQNTRSRSSIREQTGYSDLNDRSPLDPTNQMNVRRCSTGAVPKRSIPKPSRTADVRLNKTTQDKVANDRRSASKPKFDRRDEYQRDTVSSIHRELSELLEHYYPEKRLSQGNGTPVETQTDNSLSKEYVTDETQTCNEIFFESPDNTRDTRELNLRLIVEFTNELRNTRAFFENLQLDQRLGTQKQKLVESMHLSLDTKIRQLINCINNIESVPSRCDVLKNKIKFAKQYILEKEKEIIDLRKENNSLTNKIADISYKFEDSKKLLVVSDRVCAELQHDISKLKHEVMKLKETSKFLEQNDKKLKDTSVTESQVMNMKLRIHNLYVALKQKNIAMSEQTANLNEMFNLNKELQEKLFRAETLNLNKSSILSSYKERAQSTEKELMAARNELKSVQDSKTSLQSRLSKLEVNVQRSAGKLRHFSVSSQCDLVSTTNDKSVTCIEMKEIWTQTETVGDSLDEQIRQCNVRHEEIKEWLVKSETKIFQYESSIQQLLNMLFLRKEELLQNNAKMKSNPTRNLTANNVCELLDLTPAELAQLYDNSNNNSESKDRIVQVNDWMVAIRGITSCPLFSEALSCFLYKTIISIIKFQ